MVVEQFHVDPVGEEETLLSLPEKWFNKLPGQRGDISFVDALEAWAKRSGTDGCGQKRRPRAKLSKKSTGYRLQRLATSLLREDKSKPPLCIFCLDDGADVDEACGKLQWSPDWPLFFAAHELCTLMVPEVLTIENPSSLGKQLFDTDIKQLNEAYARGRKLSDTSTSIRLLCLLLLTCSFVFILTGVILNSQSSSTLFTSMGNLKTNLGEVFEDISKFSENGKISLICFADNLVNDTLNEVTTNVQTMPKFLTDTFRELIGITIFDQVDVNKIQETITTSRQQCRSISKSIDDLQSSSPSRDCSAKLHALKTIIESLTDQLNNVEDIVSIRNIADTADKDLHRMISDKTKDVVGTVTNKVRSEYNGYRNKVEDDHTITDFLDKVKKGSGDALEQTYSSSVYTATKTLFAPLVSIPGIIALLFILIAATFITISCLGSRSSLSRYSSNFSGSFVMTGFYILIVFAFFVTILSSVEYLGGSFISTACKTLFQDPSLSRLPDFDKVELIPGDIDNVKISLGDVLTHCREDRTLYTATGLNSVLNSNYVLKKLELPSIKDGTAGLVDQAKQEMSKLQKQMKDHENQIKELRKHINDLTDELTPIVSLNECEATDQATTRKILDGVASLKTSILVIRDEVERISTALLSLLSLSPNVIDGKVDEITAKFTDLVEKPVRQGIDTGFVGLT
ncbi:hypothetical protein Y032_0010g1048 [Ancylostoma ceylanicum]|uniref:Uncharacterized protein n=1 Tax=Ancylostoma ceylanicum TaxID=53326 RepID=A0A016VG29_9BILA|nr:hypothetical protein Y032_0010g1048 [Ancylostoma ceylanicum]